MNTYTPTGAVQKISDTVWAVPTASGLKYFTPSIDAHGYDGTESMPLRAGGGGNSTQIPWEVVQSGEFGRYGGTALGFDRENRAGPDGITGHTGWFFDTNPGQATYKYDTGGSFWGDVLSNLVTGPGVPAAGFLGAGAFNSGGLGNFLSSFGGEVGGAAGAGAGGGAGGISGGEMFDPFADFGADYFAGAGDFAGGGGLSAADAAEIDSWLANEGNFTSDILGNGPKLPNGTPVDLFLKNIQVQMGLSNKDLISLAGRLGAAGLGALASNKQASALKNLAGQYTEYGAPYRAILAQSYANPSAFLANSPDIKAAVDQGTSALARALSVRGNPAQSGTALQEMQNYATQGLYGQLGNERQRLANFGGLTALTSAVPSLSAQAIGANSGLYNALGYGLQQVTNPQPTIDDLMKSINTGGLA